MSDYRSSHQQLNDELNQLYKQMTDPEEHDKARRKKERAEVIKNMRLDYGL